MSDFDLYLMDGGQEWGLLSNEGETLDTITLDELETVGTDAASKQAAIDFMVNLTDQGLGEKMGEIAKESGLTRDVIGQLREISENLHPVQGQEAYKATEALKEAMDGAPAAEVGPPAPEGSIQKLIQDDFSP